MEERQIAAERRTRSAKARMQLIASDVEAARAHVARLIAINQRLKSTTKAEEEWSKKGRRAALKGVVLGSITLEVGDLCPQSCLLLCSGAFKAATLLHYYLINTLRLDLLKCCTNHNTMRIPALCRVGKRDSQGWGGSALHIFTDRVLQALISRSG